MPDLTSKRGDSLDPCSTANLASQCLSCGHVEASASDVYQCARCLGLELHVYPIRDAEDGQQGEKFAFHLKDELSPICISPSRDSQPC